MRVREIGWSGLTVALALAFLMVTCNVANERNIQRDVSYFKTSSPGDSTKNIVAGVAASRSRCCCSSPTSNEVKDQVRDYFEALASATGHITIEEHDRLGDAELAGKYKVTKDGVDRARAAAPATRRSRRRSRSTPTSRRRARAPSKLRNFDREVNSALLKLVREKRKAYLIAGHGEITDPDSIPPELKGKVPERRTTVFKKRLGELNYEVKDLGLMDLAQGRARRRDGRDDARADGRRCSRPSGTSLVALPRQGRPPDDRARSEGATRRWARSRASSA